MHFICNLNLFCFSVKGVRARVCVRVCPWASTSEKLLRSLKELFHVIPSICLQKKGMDHWDVQRVASDLRFGARTMASATATQRCGRKIRRREDGLANFKPLVAATYGGRFMIYP